MAITKVINDAVDLNQTSDYSGLRLPVGTTGNVVESFTTDYLVVGGGGGTSGDSPGGGGGGGLRTSYDSSTTTTNSLSFPSGKTAIATYMLDNNATDISGNYNGTATNITYNTGKYGGGAVFNGSSSYIQTILALSSTDVTTSFWFKADALSSTASPFFFTSNGGRVDFFIIGTGTNSANGALDSIQLNVSTALTQWNHLAVVFEGFAGSYSGTYGSAITFTAYINGNAVTSTGSLTPYAQVANGYEGNLRIGRNGYNYYFDGSIDQVRIYNTALSSTDVSNIYNNEVQVNSGGGAAAESNLTLQAGTAYDVTVGAGGASNTIGSSSIFSTITSTGGGRGGGNSGGYNGGNGGSGGGGAGGIYSSAGGNGTFAQGYAGGSSGANTGGTSYPGGGGGGAVSVGASPSGSGDPGGNGGTGLAVNILNATNAASASIGEVSSSNVYYSGGGGGSTYIGTPGTGGLGGAGDGDRSDDGTSANNGTINTGGGGGGTNATGGLGVVILRYPTASVSSFTVTGTLNTPSTGSQTQFTEGSDTVIIFTEGTGTVTFSGIDPAPPQGALRTNTSYSEDGSASVIEHYNGTDWKRFDAIKYCTTNTLNFPSGAGCIASYNLDNNVNDIGNTYNGVNSNVTFTASGKFGAAAVFNGSSSIINDVLSGFTYDNKNITFSAWIKSSKTTSGNNVIIGQGISNADGGWGIATGYAAAQKLSFSIAKPGVQSVIGSVTMNTGNWQHIVVIVDFADIGSGGTSAVKMYVDGVEDTGLTGNLTQNFDESSYNTAIGGTYSGSNARFFDGDIDQVRIFNTAISSAQVEDLYNNEIACS